MSSTSLETASIQRLAEEIVELSKTHQPSPNAFAPDAPLIAKAKELISAVQQPMDHCASQIMKVTETAVIRTLLYLKAIQTIPTMGSISLSDLAAITGAQASLLERLLRVVVGTGFILQTDSGKYAHTHLSLGYAGNGAAAFLEMLYDEIFPPLIAFPKYLDAKRESAGLVEPESSTHNPMSWYAGQEGKTAAEIMSQDPARVQRFQGIMGSVAHMNPYTGVFDFGILATDEPGRAVFVDVGGGHGGAIKKMLGAHLEIKADQCVLQDREEVIASAK